MILPPLFKYLDLNGAKLTLGTRTFKHSAPSDFNDTKDLTIEAVFPEDLESALVKLSNGFTDVILRNLSESPTCKSPLKENVALIQRVYRTNLEAANIVKNEIAKGKEQPVFDVEQMRTHVVERVIEINDFMHGFRVLCATTHRNSDEMWERYADRRRGVVLRIEPSLAKDSKFRLFRPVVYREKRPPLYDDTLDFISHGLFGDQEAQHKATIEKIIYAKTLEWQYENEYRLAIAVRKSERPWNTLPYHAEEITELSLGRAMTDQDKEEVVRLALATNPKMLICH